jgi:integrase
VLAGVNQLLGLSRGCGVNEDDVLLFRSWIEKVSHYSSPVIRRARTRNYNISGCTVFSENRTCLYPAMKAAEIPMESHANGLHLFRHTVVSMVSKHGGLLAAQHQAGHSNISTTADAYTHVDEEQTQANAQLLQEALAPHLLPALPADLVTC